MRGASCGAWCGSSPAPGILSACIAALVRRPRRHRTRFQVLSRNRDTAWRWLARRQPAPVFDNGRTSRGHLSSHWPRPARCSRVQTVIAEAILHDQVNFGIYQSDPTPGAAGTGRRSRNREKYRGPRPRCCQAPIPRRRRGEYRDLSDEERTAAGRVPAQTVPAVTTAIGATAAIAILGQSDLRAAGAVLSSIWPPEIKASSRHPSP